MVIFKRKCFFTRNVLAICVFWVYYINIKTKIYVRRNTNGIFKR